MTAPLWWLISMNDILIARILYPVHALGPGNRLGIWVCGCNRRCPFCANPELQMFDENKRIDITDAAESIRSILDSQPVDGITISGGEPFEQANELNLLLSQIKDDLPEDILIFTGYTIEDLDSRCDPSTDNVLRYAAVIIDGEYQEELNNGSVLRGSDNQRIHFLKASCKNRYMQYINTGRRLYESFATSEGVFMIGLHKKGFRKNLEEQKSKRGLI